MQNFKQRMVDPAHFAMAPRPDVPRSIFHVDNAHKTTFDAGYLVPIYCDEVIPGDTYNVRMTAFVRVNTLLFPVMDNMELCTFFFFVPMRLIWSNWQKFMGEQTNPSDSISYLVPTSGPNVGYVPGSLQDYFGLPVNTQVPGGSTFSHNSLPLRAYNKIWNEWFRDENLQNSASVPMGDGPDDPSATLFVLQRRGKRHDYFTSALPWPQKGTAVTVPLGTSATVKTNATPLYTGANPAMLLMNTAGGAPNNNAALSANASTLIQSTSATTGNSFGLFPTNLYADLSTATGATINALRQSFQIQKLLERDARGGTRYTEILRAHFGVVSPDARLQRPEYLGGGVSPINVNPVAQTSSTATQPSPAGTLTGVGTSVAHHGFSKSFVEHGYIIGLVNVRAALTYQQGLHKMWSRSTRYDFYWPEFAHLGEQAVLNKEIYVAGNAADNNVFGYQERYAEYRYKPSQVTGEFRSGVPGTLDAWHLAQQFGSLPTLSSTFIQDTPPVSRVLAAGSQADGQQFLFDSVFTNKLVRPMPMYGVPGFIDRF